jgi:SET domain-containing protein
MTPDELLADLSGTRIALAPSEIHGVGVFALVDIPTRTRDLFSPPRQWVPVPIPAVEALPPHALELVQRYCLHDDENYFLPPHGFRVYDLVVFLNHSSDPNLRSVDGGDYFETTRRVTAGEELTIDYETLET